jgi:hypothetical protein
MFYIFGVILTFIFLSQESKNPSVGRRELIYALCISIVWPIYAPMLALYYQNELGATLADLLGFNSEFDEIWGPLEEQYETQLAQEDDLENVIR